MTMYRKVGKDRLYESIVGEIERLIVSGQLRPGDVLPPERELGERFGVSRTAVREAIKVLTEKELLVVQPGRGATVAHPSFDVVTNSLTLWLKLEMADAQQLMEVRMGLEPEMAALAAVRASEQQAAEIEAIVLREADLADSSEEAIALDIEFHARICDAAGNVVARAMLLSIQDLLNETITAAYGHEDVPVLAAESHLRIVRAIQERNPRRAADEMRTHLSSFARQRGVSLPEDLGGAVDRLG